MLINEKDFFIIAEIGINHGGNYEKAIKLIKSANKAGASAVKFQTYKTEKRVKKNSPIFNILKKCELSFETFYKIKKFCDKNKITFFSTPFDIESVDFLEKINVKLYKISSFDISNYQLVNRIIKTKKPTIISTGMATLNEIEKVTNMFSNKKIKHYILHCISSYPNNEKNSFLKNISYLKDRLNVPIGLSDHTNDIKTSIYSYLLGAKIIEKHFKLSVNDRCVDAPVSITPNQLRKLINEISNIKKIMGTIKFGVRESEKKTLIYKRH